MGEEGSGSDRRHGRAARARRADCRAGIGGFSILQAASVDALKKTLEGHLHLKMPGGSIEVFELLSLPGI